MQSFQNMHLLRTLKLPLLEMSFILEKNQQCSKKLGCRKTVTIL